MIREMTIGEMPMETSFVGASAAPSQAPAAKPERMPSNWSFLERVASGIAGGIVEEATGGIFLQSEISANETKQQQSTHQNGDGHPKMDVAENAGPPAARVGFRFRRLHSASLKNRWSSAETPIVNSVPRG